MGKGEKEFEAKHLQYDSESGFKRLNAKQLFRYSRKSIPVGKEWTADNQRLCSLDTQAVQESHNL